MNKDLQNYQIARFALNKTFINIPTEVVDQLKKKFTGRLSFFFWVTTATHRGQVDEPARLFCKKL